MFWEPLKEFVLFQSTLPLRGATPAGIFIMAPLEFQSTLPLRGATQGAVECTPDAPISIHAPLAGSDRNNKTGEIINVISIHAPLAGSDFQQGSASYQASYFNPRSPCGERHRKLYFRLRSRDFNPRSPCGERPHGLVMQPGEVAFQSTLPLRGATLAFTCHFHAIRISIHAPLAGSDNVSLTKI